MREDTWLKKELKVESWNFSFWAIYVQNFQSQQPFQCTKCRNLSRWVFFFPSFFLPFYKFVKEMWLTDNWQTDRETLLEDASHIKNEKMNLETK